MAPLAGSGPQSCNWLLAGLETYGTASSGKQHRVAEQGATPIDYQREDFLAQVRRHTGQGVDAAFDAIGGAHFFRR